MFLWSARKLITRLHLARLIWRVSLWDSGRTVLKSRTSGIWINGLSLNWKKKNEMSCIKAGKKP